MDGVSSGSSEWAYDDEIPHEMISEGSEGEVIINEMYVEMGGELIDESLEVADKSVLGKERGNRTEDELNAEVYCNVNAGSLGSKNAMPRFSRLHSQDEMFTSLNQIPSSRSKLNGTREAEKQTYDYAIPDPATCGRKCSPPETPKITPEPPQKHPRKRMPKTAPKSTPIMTPKITEIRPEIPSQMVKKRLQINSNVPSKKDFSNKRNKESEGNFLLKKMKMRRTKL